MKVVKLYLYFPWFLYECIHLSISFLRLPLKICLQLDGLTKRCFCLIVLEARSLKSRCWQCWFLLRALREGHVPGLSPSFCEPQASPRLQMAVLSLSLFASSFLCPNVPLLIRTQLYKIRPHPNDLPLTWLPLWRRYLQIKSQCDVQEVRTSTYHFWRTQFSL